ncbi:hydroxyacid dehydrogenase [Aliifodinibius salicampi]|uniref:Hydroxyacid dehydrogenase n=1 Tax=Fodinibius salicampi TaxID=1920655 RepID=A0ABT3PY10_9BACT|nr:hydroxyacid dehydrogenase [Fodinibius salicampi]MCW9712736.1 hydroxyacid dehydrogenase [Fodinibius salicampi]
MKKNVLLLETIASEADTLLRENTTVHEAFQSMNPVEIAKNATIHSVVTRGKGQVNRELMDACPELEVVARCGVGLDNVDVGEATRRGIKVINAPGSNSSTIAEHALTLMLMGIRDVWNSVERVKNGDWSWRNQYSGDELRDKTLGILGMGNIGRRVAKLGDAFGMKVVYWDKFPVQSEYESCTMESVFKQADVVTVHVPLLDETKKMVGEKQLNLMKPDAWLINTARGPIIDETALLKALDSGKISGFAADVLSVEPPDSNHSLVNHPKTLITPHTGSLTSTTYRNMCVSTVQNVIAVLNGSTPDPESVFNRNELNSK